MFFEKPFQGFLFCGTLTIEERVYTMRYVMVVFSIFFAGMAVSEQPLLRLPLTDDFRSLCVQGAGGIYSHNEPATRYDIDLDTPNDRDDAVVAPTTGVAYIHYGNENFGNHICIDIGGDFFVLMGHLKSISISNGTVVSTGEVIGIEGSTGFAQGDHVHFGVHKGNPQIDAAQSVSVLAERIWTRDYSLGTESREYRSDEFIGDVSSGHVYEAVVPSQMDITGYSGNQSFNSPIVESYVNNGGINVLGQPTPNLANPNSDGYVDTWPFALGSTNCLFQTFDGGSLGSCAIVYDAVAGNGKAYPMHGQLWGYYRNNNGPLLSLGGMLIGGPVENERYGTTTTTGHQMVIQKMAHGYLVYDTVTGQHDATTGLSGISIAIIPGNGVDLQLAAYALSSDRVYVSTNDIAAARYALYQDDVYIGDLVNLELVVTGLQPDTTHTYKVVTLDANGAMSKESNVITVITPSAVTPTTPLIQLNYVIRGDTLEVGLSQSAGANYYRLYVDGEERSNGVPGQTLTVFVWWGSNSHDAYLEAYNAGNLVGRSTTVSFQTGQNISVTPQSGPVTIGPNQSGEVSWYISSNNVAAYEFPTKIISAEPSDWLVIDAIQWFDPAYVSANQTVTLCTVTFHSTDVQPAVSKAVLSVYVEFYSTLPGVIMASRQSNFLMNVEPYIDLVPTIAESNKTFTTEESVSVPVQVHNNGNSVCPSSRIEAYIDDIRVASLLVPQLDAGVSWDYNLPLGMVSVGSHQVRIIVDPYDEIPESIEDNNSVKITIVVNEPPVPAPTIHIEQLPFYGDVAGSGEAKLLINAVDPAVYGVRAWVQVGGQWYSRQTEFSDALVNEDGSCTLTLCQDIWDYFATECYFVVIPHGEQSSFCWPDVCLERPSFNDAIADISVLLPTKPVTNELNVSAQLDFVRVAPVGDSSETIVLVSGLEPINYPRYRVVFYHRVNVATPPWEYWRWYYHSNFATPTTPINADGTASVVLNQQPGDATSNQVMAFLVPAIVQVPECGDNLECGEVPLVTDFIASAQAARPSAGSGPSVANLATVISVDPEKPTVDKAVTLETIVTNTGSALSLPCTLTISAFTAIRTAEIPILTPNESWTSTETVTPLVVGSQTIEATFDDCLAARTGGTSAVVEVKPALPDLTIASLTGTQFSFFKNCFLLITTRVVNGGGSTATACTISVKDVTRGKKQTYTIASLPPGKSVTKLTLLKIAPRSTTVVQSIIDSAQSVTEENEENNILSITKVTQ